MKAFLDFITYHPYDALIDAILIWNGITFLITAFDKFRAKHKMWRVPEKRMILFSALLGGGGVLAAFYLFRHKTQHKKLLFGVWFFFVLWLILVIGLLIFKAVL